MARNGAPVRRVMTDNAFAYPLSRDFQDVLTNPNAKHVLSTHGRGHEDDPRSHNP